MLTQEQLTMMAENVARIRENMAAAAREAGRDPADILLCAACKTRTVEEVIASTVLPIDLFGENHVQELVEKTDANAYCGKPGHFIGHLQTNKVKNLVGRVNLIQSVDSVRLAREISRLSVQRDVTTDILLEVNIGREENKSGVAPEELESLLGEIAGMPGIFVRGLMAIPPICDEKERLQNYFSLMHQYFIDIKSKKSDNVAMDFLSMGMSSSALCMPARPVGGKTCPLLYRVAGKKATAHCASIRRMQQAATSCGVSHRQSAPASSSRSPMP